MSKKSGKSVKRGKGEKKKKWVEEYVKYLDLFTFEYNEGAPRIAQYVYGGTCKICAPAGRK